MLQIVFCHLAPLAFANPSGLRKSYLPRLEGILNGLRPKFLPAFANPLCSAFRTCSTIGFAKAGGSPTPLAFAKLIYGSFFASDLFLRKPQGSSPLLPSQIAICASGGSGASPLRTPRTSTLFFIQPFKKGCQNSLGFAYSAKPRALSRLWPQAGRALGLRPKPQRGDIIPPSPPFCQV